MNTNDDRLESILEALRDVPNPSARLSAIIAALTRGDCRIVDDSECQCHFDWRIDDGDLRDDSDTGGDCYGCNALAVGAALVAWKMDTGERGDFSEDGPGDLPEPLWDALECDSNPEHERRRRESLVEFLMRPGFVLGEAETSGFGNEYCMIIRKSPGATAPSREEAEAWAAKYFGDARGGDRGHIGFRFEE